MPNVQVQSVIQRINRPRVELGRKESVELPWGPSGTAGETCTPMAKSDGSSALVPQAKTFLNA